MAIDTSVPPLPKGGVLNPKLFRKTVPVLAAWVSVRQIADIIRHKTAQRCILTLPRLIPVIKPEGKNVQYKYILLASDKEEELDPEGLAYVKEHAERIVPYNVELTYDFWSANDVLTALLPEDIIVPAAFTQAGHIIHLNLRSRQLPYKYLIGEVLLSKYKPSLRTVVNKTDRIHAKYRFFEMELLAGDPDYMVNSQEAGCRYIFDYREVYYNTRLSSEHARLVEKFGQEDLVADVMGGVGPFAIPAAMKGCAVMMNDLNPMAVKWARENIELNKVQRAVRVYEMDGVEFIRGSALEAWQYPFPSYRPHQSSRERARQNRIAVIKKKNARDRSRERSLSPPPPNLPSPESLSSFQAPPSLFAATAASRTGQFELVDEGVRRAISHYVLNLPATAILFLFAFRGLLRPLMDDHSMGDVYGPNKNMPMVHVYCFARTQEDPELMKQDILERASIALNYKLTLSMPELDVYWVRKTAPIKEMFCLSFRLPWEVAIERVPENELQSLKDALAEAHADQDLDDDEDFSEQSPTAKRFSNLSMV